ncbi:hypothetical protein GGS20DRAFT_432356 [Poronia punctata]|nr:hypothetical protein GGS20DRAFT_432356 [Poronia punctata]
MSALPFVQVRDLAPTASFYSAVGQPLGLRFLSANASSIVFGDASSGKTPVFEVRAVPANTPMRPTRMILSVGSPSVVSAFHAAARRAHPTGSSNILLRDQDGSPSGESRAAATDLEGNMLEVVHLNRRGSSGATRMLDWNLDVVALAGPARSVAGSTATSRAATETAPADGVYSYLKRSITTSTVQTTSAQDAQQSKGLSTGGMIGTVLGAVAAGAAVGAGITYVLSKNDRNRAPRQEYDTPSFQRRATYPEPYPDQRPYYVERAVERIHYPEHNPDKSRPDTNKPRQSQATDPVVEIDDRASRHTVEPRTRSTREPLMITDADPKNNAVTENPWIAEAEHRSRAGSRHTSSQSRVQTDVADHRSHVGSREKSKRNVHSQAPDQRSHVSSRSRHRDAEAETYVSARSEKSTASTVRPAKSSSKAPSHYSSATTKPRDTSKAEWEDFEDDVDPSDSISNMGDRPKPNPRDIPFLHTRERLIIQ